MLAWPCSWDWLWTVFELRSNVWVLLDKLFKLSPSFLISQMGAIAVSGTFIKMT